MAPEPQRKRTAPPPLPVGAASAARPRVNFYKLDIASLRKYHKLHRLNSLPSNATKDQLVAAVVRHFNIQPPENEIRTITAFVHAVRRRKNAGS